MYLDYSGENWGDIHNSEDISRHLCKKRTRAKEFQCGRSFKNVIFNKLFGTSLKVLHIYGLFAETTLSDRTCSKAQSLKLVAGYELGDDQEYQVDPGFRIREFNKTTNRSCQRIE